MGPQGREPTFWAKSAMISACCRDITGLSYHPFCELGTNPFAASLEERPIFNVGFCLSKTMYRRENGWSVYGHCVNEIENAGSKLVPNRSRTWRRGEGGASRPDE